VGSKSIRSRFARDSITTRVGRCRVLCRPQQRCWRPLRLIRARCKGLVQSVFADRVEDLVQERTRFCDSACRSRCTSYERAHVDASRRGKVEANGSGVLVCGRPAAYSRSRYSRSSRSTGCSFSDQPGDRSEIAQLSGRLCPLLTALDQDLATRTRGQDLATRFGFWRSLSGRSHCTHSNRKN
jgi:hypothetical protein